MLRTLAGALLLSTFSFAAFAADEPAKVADSSMGPIWVDANGMTLYTFEEDKEGAASACLGECIVEWPPLLAPEGAQPMDEWTIYRVTGPALEQLAASARNAED